MEINYLSVIVLLLTVHYTFFLLKIYLGLNKLSRPGLRKDITEYVSVIIPFRNESDHILQSLKSMEMLDYPKDRFEVIYVNDNSTDDSLRKLLSVKKSCNVKVLSLKAPDGLRAYKKRAVTFGIQNSSGEIVVTTDADCVHSPRWLRALVSYFDDKTAMVSGSVDFIRSQNLWEKIQRLEFQGLILAGAGLLSSGTPVICSAANLAYKKSVFDQVNGYSDQLSLSSGDDELLMQKIYQAGKFKIRFCPDPEAVVKTLPNETISDFFSQRKRWASKSVFYKDKLLVLRLILIFLFYISIPILAAMSIFNPGYLLILLIGFISKLVMEFLIMRKGDKLIFNSRLLKYIIPAEFFQILYIIIAALLGLKGNFHWKERRVKR